MKGKLVRLIILLLFVLLGTMLRYAGEEITRLDSLCYTPE